WRLGESSGTIAKDSSGNGRDATYEGQPLLGQPGALAGDPDTSVGFNSTGTNNDAVWTPPSGDSYRGPFTVVAWIYNTGSNGHVGQRILSTRSPTGEYSFDFALGGCTTGPCMSLFADAGNATAWLLNVRMPYIFQINTWYQVAARVTDADVTFYV